MAETGETGLPAPVRLRSGLAMPAVGLGTWRLGEGLLPEAEEIDALLAGIDAGLTHIDTAEMYGDGATEELVGRALRHRPRDAVFLVSKFYPMNATPARMRAACEASLRRLGTDRLDLYLLHWPGSVPFEETLEGARRLLDAGMIRAFGVSNVDAGMLGDLLDGGLADLIDCNQVMFNPARRGIEYDLLPMMRNAGIACVAYTPIEPGRLSRTRAFAAVAEEAGMTPPELALAWHVTRGLSVPIPKAGRAAHVAALARAARTRLAPDQLAAIDRACPPPSAPEPLDII